MDAREDAKVLLRYFFCNPLFLSGKVLLRYFFFFLRSGEKNKHSRWVFMLRRQKNQEKQFQKTNMRNVT